MSRKARVALYAAAFGVVLAALFAAVVFLAWITNGWLLWVACAVAFGYLCTTVAMTYVDQLERKEASR